MYISNKRELTDTLNKTAPLNGINDNHYHTSTVKLARQPQLHSSHNMPTPAHVFPEDNMLNGYKLMDEYNKESVCITDGRK